MPLLKAAHIHKSKIQAETDAQQIPLINVNADGTVPNGQRLNPRAVGKEYECYIGSLYEKHGYNVEYNGINKGSHDRCRDLICRTTSKKQIYTMLVQCKCYMRARISIGDVYYFYGSVRHYAIQNPSEVVMGVFWTTNQVSPAVYQAATELGIRINYAQLPNN